MPKVLSSPYLHGPADTATVMRRVVLALVPGIAAAAWVFGWGVVTNILVAVSTAYASEAVILAMRGRPVAATLSDNSALVTAVLLALAIPPMSPWWMIAIGVFFAIVFAKHLYGGLGFNPFNPAMAAYVLLLISFPLEMTSWATPGPLGGHSLDLAQTVSYVFTGALPAGVDLDSLTSATVLDTMKMELSRHQTVTQTLGEPIFGALAGKGWEAVSGLFLLGGLWLIWKRVITWHVPVGLLGALFVMATLFHVAGPERYPGPLFHLFAGGAMLGAFFIATDPVTCATSNRGRLLFGIGAGVLLYVIRTWGGYPDAVAFSVLLMNMAAPTIDHYTQPRVFGHSKE